MPFIIDDATNMDLLVNPALARGYVERDLAVDPPEMFAPPAEMPMVPRSDWSDLIKEKAQLKTRLSDIRMKAMNGAPMPSLNQNPQGFCWAYSTVGTIMIARANAGMAYVRLSPHAVACKIKNFRDEGGWCGLSAKFLREQGCPSEEFWPQRAMSRSYDIPATWQNAALHKITDDWVDLARPAYDQNLTFDQVASCLLNNIPCAVDFNFWAHSVCALDLVEVEPGNFGLLILNSWGDGWGDNGTGILTGKRSLPDGAVATRFTTPSVA